MNPSMDSRITRWVKDHTGELLSWAYHRTSDLKTAEDLVQETFLAAVERLDSFRSDSHPKTWLFSILNNKIADHHRRGMRHRTVPLDDDGPSAFFDEQGHWRPNAAPGAWSDDDGHLLDDENFRAAFLDCLKKLPGPWHDCLTMRFLKDITPGTICQELGISATNYWQIVHRAKLSMRRCLQKEWFDTE
ncbi:MAG: sigma-70 family RNA polymerase sigma factor [Bacteroidetes bacterium]|nr:sigma-70 family RNA polymerase sigma factor [Bacteroidota bacterium]